MKTTHSFFYDVLIAGAGPVGLFLACELQLAGVSVLVVEQADEADTALKRMPFGMRGLSIPTVEALYRRGLLADVTGAIPQSKEHGGHFAGIPFSPEKIDTTAWPYRVHGPAALPLATTMSQLETALARRAIESGAIIRRGIRVHGFSQNAHGVTVTTSHGSFQAAYLVGCDGGRSTVRKAAGFAFEGTGAEFTGYSVQAALGQPDAFPLGRHYTQAGMYFHSAPGTLAMVEFDGGASHRSTALDVSHIEGVLGRITGRDIRLNGLHLATSWTDRAYRASTYQIGHVLLAGDAAHIHSPLGGQGLNLGLGDAMNLGWKLAATLRGNAAPGLLATYASERIPVADQVLDWSRAQVAILRPEPASRALEGIIRDLMATTDGATWFAERVWHASARYDLGCSHPLVGRSMPDVTLTDGQRVGERLRHGKGLLVDFTGEKEFAAWAAPWRGHMDFAASAAPERFGMRAALVRPDGVIVWVDDAAGGPSASFEAEATRWLGCRT